MREKHMKINIRLALISLLILAGLVAGCTMDMNESILEYINPPDHQLGLYYQDNQYKASSTVTLKTIYSASGNPETLQVRNTSGTAVVLRGVSVSDTSHFTLNLSSSAPVSVAAATTFPFTIAFSAATEGTFSTTITVSYTADGKDRSFDVKLSGTRSGGSNITLTSDANIAILNDSAAYSFGYVSSGPIDKTFTIRNTGSSALTIGSIVSTNSTAFSITSSSSNISIAPGLSATLAVRCVNGTVASSATIVISSDASNVPVFNLNVSSVGTSYSAINVLDSAGTEMANNSTSAYSFGYAASGPIDRAFTIRNTGGKALAITSVLSSDPSFTVTTTGLDGSSIAVGASVTMTVRKTDGSTAGTATISVISDASNAPVFKLNVSSTGSTISSLNVFDDAGNAIASDSATAYNFGYSVSPIEKTFTLRNTGGKAISLTTVLSSNDSAFSITSLSANTIAAGGFVTLKVNRLDGTKAATGTINIISDASNITTFKLNVSSENYASGTIAVKDTTSNASMSTSTSLYYDIGYSASAIVRSFTITNTGTGNLTITSILSNNEAGIAVYNDSASGTKIASGATATFSLRQADPSVSATAKITISSSDPVSPTYAFNVYGGNASINVTQPNTFVYRLSKKGFDFGYASGATTKDIVLTNKGSAPIKFVSANCTLTPSSAFSFTTIPASIAAGSTGTLTIGYIPSSTTSWDEAECVLKDEFGRTYTVNFTGSGFKQPANITASPSLWLRADRLEVANIASGTTNKVSSWQDVSGNPYSPIASAVASRYPEYVSEGINSMPSLKFSNISPQAHMQIAATDNFITASLGLTTFIVFKTDSTLPTTEYILSPYVGTTEVFPKLYFDIMYYDSSDGYYASPTGTPVGTVVGTPLSQFRFNLQGYNGVFRNPMAAIGDRALVPTTDTTYSIVMIYDSRIPATTTVTTAANIMMSINQASQKLRYYYSQSGAPPATPANTAAYGYPVSTDGLGTKWPTVYGTYDFLNSIGTGNAYLYNKIDTTTANTNKNIRTLNIGASSSSTAFFCGQIAEIIMYSDVLTDPDIAVLNTYLKNKYGVTTWP